VTGVGASPNPFSPHNAESSTISFSLNKAATVSVSVYDKQGRLVRQWTGLALPAGNGSQVWDGKDADGHDVPPGLDGYRVDIVAAAGVESAQGSVDISVNP
jgi:flagellar hook assembly protein FlgD